MALFSYAYFHTPLQDDRRGNVYDKRCTQLMDLKMLQHVQMLPKPRELGLHMNQGRPHHRVLAPSSATIGV